MAELLHEGVWFDQRKCEAAESALARLKCPTSHITATFAQISADIQASLKAAPQPVQDASSCASSMVGHAALTVKHSVNVEAVRGVAVCGSASLACACLSRTSPRTLRRD